MNAKTVAIDFIFTRSVSLITHSLCSRSVNVIENIVSTSEFFLEDLFTAMPPMYFE